MGFGGRANENPRRNGPSYVPTHLITKSDFSSTDEKWTLNEALPAFEKSITVDFELWLI